MKLIPLIKPIIVFIITITSTLLFVLQFPQTKKTSFEPNLHSMSISRSFVLWLHGLGDSGPANEPIRTLFTSPQFRNTNWSFPSAPNAPVTCNYGHVMPSWFDIHEIPVTAVSLGFLLFFDCFILIDCFFGISVLLLQSWKGKMMISLSYRIMLQIRGSLLRRHHRILFSKLSMLIRDDQNIVIPADEIDPPPPQP
ncbi:PREDICTED: probable carboxylesterase SOBER1-like [Lupinus angustifolius]|uniref:probable carboxylesterase SOBER1-like n=1 Tax=Lupinus angustifolius TaxID=3871 RepID=UPI00092E9823|nr:PREDICTED: probable carboxylesterase SOBER1-like [Lupinus angustifolius]